MTRYGGREAHGREDQPSHAMLDNEIKEQRVLGTVLPSIFLGVAAFLLNVVVSRLVATQREQIAALKALGYPNRTIAAHYLKLVLVIVVAGLALGVALGDWLGTLMTGLYAEFFHFPSFEHRIAPWLLVVSIGITVATAVLGTLNAILATVRLAPAEAMRPPAPGRYRRTLVERIGITRIGPSLRMILRNMERRPLAHDAVDRRRRGRGGDRRDGQLLPRCDRLHRRLAVQRGDAQRRDPVDDRGRRRQRAPRGGPPARRDRGRVGTRRAGALRQRPPQPSAARSAA